MKSNILLIIFINILISSLVKSELVFLDFYDGKRNHKIAFDSKKNDSKLSDENSYGIIITRFIYKDVNGSKKITIIQSITYLFEGQKYIFNFHSNEVAIDEKSHGVDIVSEITQNSLTPAKAVLSGKIIVSKKRTN